MSEIRVEHDIDDISIFFRDSKDCPNPETKSWMGSMELDLDADSTSRLIASGPHKLVSDIYIGAAHCSMDVDTKKVTVKLDFVGTGCWTLVENTDTKELVK